MKKNFPLTSLPPAGSPVPRLSRGHNIPHPLTPARCPVPCAATQSRP